MRSVLTILILLIVVGCIVLYTTKGVDGFRGGGDRGWEHGGVNEEDNEQDNQQVVNEGFGFGPYVYGPAAQEAAIREMVEHPCSTDLDCPVGHCSMFGLCTNSLSL